MAAVSVPARDVQPAELARGATNAQLDPGSTVGVSDPAALAPNAAPAGSPTHAAAQRAEGDAIAQARAPSARAPSAAHRTRAIRRAAAEPVPETAVTSAPSIADVSKGLRASCNLSPCAVRICALVHVPVWSSLTGAMHLQSQNQWATCIGTRGPGAPQQRQWAREVPGQQPACHHDCERLELSIYIPCTIANIQDPKVIPPTVCVGTSWGSHVPRSHMY